MELLTEDVLSEFQDLLKKMVTDISKIDDHHQTAIHIQSLMSLSELLFSTKLVRSSELPSREPNFLDTLRWIKTDPRPPKTQHCPGTDLQWPELTFNWLLGDIDLEFKPEQMVKAMARDSITTRSDLKLSNISADAAELAAKLAKNM